MIYLEAHWGVRLGGVPPHRLPEMYGRVKEKTIWLYWNTYKIPDFVGLCLETIRNHSGGFDVRLVHRDEVDRYVSPFELPLNWKKFPPARQKDALMNALLARYGGVAMDASMVMFRPLDDLWDEMVERGAFFRGLQYQSHETAVWFLMARRETLFRSAVTAGMIGMGTDIWTWKYARHPLKNGLDSYFAMGDGTVSPTIGMYDYGRQKCRGTFFGWYGECYPPVQTEETFGAQLGPERLIIEDPLNYAQLEFASDPDFPLWTVADRPNEWNSFSGRYKHSCWGPLHFVKMFKTGGKAKAFKRHELVKMHDTFLCRWFCLAGTDQCGLGEACGSPEEATLNA